MIDKKIFQKLDWRKVNLFIPLFVFFGIFLFFTATQAATSTLRGKAWWGDTLEYVYFNCLDDEIGEMLDIEGNLTDGYEFYSAPCSSLVHAVGIDGNSNFTGSAWNKYEGLIDFAGTATPPNYDFNNVCPTCNGDNDCWACYDEDTNRAYGWARSASSSEWLKLDSAAAEPVQIQPVGEPLIPGANLFPGDLFGTATNVGLGNLSFNCEIEEIETPGFCSLHDNYKVYIGGLQATNLSAPGWTQSSACATYARNAILRWDISSGQQDKYEIVVNDEDDLSTTSAVCYSGIQESEAGQYSIPNANDSFCTNPSDLAYGENYYWWLRLYDSTGVPTEWYKYSNNSILDTDLNIDDNPETFTTYKHELPDVYFPLPDSVLVGTSTLFDGSLSGYYSIGSPLSSTTCDGRCSFQWETTDLNAIISASTSVTTTINFFSVTSTDVSLSVSDEEQYTCTRSASLDPNYGLPIWREIKAE